MKVVIAGRMPFPIDHMLETFEKERFHVVSAGTDEDELSQVCRDADVLVVGMAKITGRILKGSRLRAVARLGVGVDNIDVTSATAHGVAVIYAGDANAESAAEHTICLILALFKKLTMADRAIREGKWTVPFLNEIGYPIELSGKTLGVVGLGNIGRRVALKARALGMKVVAYDPYVTHEDSLQQVDSLEQSLTDVLGQSDAVTIHVALTKDTHHLIGKRELDQMKEGAFFINASRGEVVDQEALVGSLENGRIAGAALDVFEPQPPDPQTPLFKLRNVIATPHIAGLTSEAWERVVSYVTDDVTRVLRGQKPIRIVNPGVLHHNGV